MSLALAASPWIALGTAVAQTSTGPSAQGAGVVAGQQHSQPSMNQNQTQTQTDMSQEPPQAHVLPPTSSAQSAPNPQPQLSK